jgi:hypothetical protein
LFTLLSAKLGFHPSTHLAPVPDETLLEGGDRCSIRSAQEEGINQWPRGERLPDHIAATNQRFCTLPPLKHHRHLFLNTVPHPAVLANAEQFVVPIAKKQKQNEANKATCFVS